MKHNMNYMERSMKMMMKLLCAAFFILRSSFPVAMTTIRAVST